MKYKYQFSLFEDIDCKNIEKKLNEMMSTGYELIEIGPLFWVYKKCKPNSKKYATIVHQPVIDMAWEEGLSEFDEYCNQVGWERVASLNRVTIYSNENLDAIELNTDPHAEYNNVKKFMKKSVLGTSIIYLILSAYLVTTLINIDKPILEFMSDYNMVLISILYVVLISFGVFSNILGIKWLLQSPKLMEELSEYPDTSFLTKITKIEVGFMAFAFAAFLIFLLASGKPYTCLHYFSYIIFLIGIVTIVNKGVHCLNKENPEDKVRKRIETVVKTLIFIVALIVTFTSISGKTHEDYDGDQGTIWLYKDHRVIYEEIDESEVDEYFERGRYEYDLYYPKSQKIYDFTLNYIHRHNDDGDLILERDGNIFIVEGDTPIEYQEQILQNTVNF